MIAAFCLFLVLYTGGAGLAAEIQIQKGPRDRAGTGSNSLRIDIPKDDVREENARKDGVDYFDGDDDRFSDRRPADKLLNEILGKPGK